MNSLRYMPKPRVTLKVKIHYLRQYCSRLIICILVFAIRYHYETHVNVRTLMLGRLKERYIKR